MSNKLSWSEKFALLDRYQPADAVAIAALDVSQAELDTARQLRQAGTIAVSADFDVDGYGNPFEGVTPDPVSKKRTTATSISKPDGQPRETATKRPSAARKRGRKGTKISEAFKAIPEQPVPVAEFAKQYGVSIPVLRQSKRFGRDSDHMGVVKVKVNKDSGVLEIWREPVSAESSESAE